MKRLAVFRSAAEVFSGVTRHYFQLLFAAWPAVLCMFALDFAQDWGVRYFGPVTEAQEAGAAARSAAEQAQGSVWQSPLVMISIGYMLLSWLIGAVAAVRWHRFVLLGEGGDKARHVRREDLDYIWTTLRLWGLMILTVVALGVLWNLVPQDIRLPVLAICIVAVLPPLMCISLALPDAAMGYGGGIMGVFEESAGNGFRLLGLFFLTVLLPVLPLAAIVFAIAPHALFFEETFGYWGSYALISGVGSFLSLYVLMLNITALSVAYREIIGLPGAVPNEPAPDAGASTV